jgi:hypothetical protein
LSYKQETDVHAFLMMIMQISTGKFRVFYITVVFLTYAFVFYIGDARCAHCVYVTFYTNFVFLFPMFSYFSKSSGKTNHGTRLYGRAMRHKFVELCSIGGIVFYLAFRFATTKEFDLFTARDWLDNKKWFDIKLLVDASRSDADHCKAMANNTYADAIKLTLRGLDIPSNHWVHLGRTLGPKILELLEEESDDIRRLGNWNPSIQESSYSIKLPLSPMRKLAGYTTANGMYFNARTTIMPSEALKLQTPFAFAISILPQVTAALLDDEGATDSTGQTAIAFLKFMNECSVIFLQDAAAMQIRKPERRDHPLFRRLACFEGPEWSVSF